MAKFNTRVGIGVTDSHYYIGIEPPLQSQEIKRLSTDEIVSKNRSNLQNSMLDTECSLLQFNRQRVTAAQVLAITEKLTAMLRRTRHGYELTVDTTMVPLQGEDSTPFNPDTNHPTYNEQPLIEDADPLNMANVFEQIARATDKQVS